jgi:hypothetical protein
MAGDIGKLEETAVVGDGHTTVAAARSFEGAGKREYLSSRNQKKETVGAGFNTSQKRMPWW